MDSMLREQDLRLVGCDGGVNNDIITLVPVDGGGDTVFVTKLQGWNMGSVQHQALSTASKSLQSMTL